MSTRSGSGTICREHAPDERRVVGLLVGLVAVDHELESADAVRDRDRHVRSRGIRPDFAVRMPEWIIRAVDDQPPGRGGGAVERHPHQSPGDAAAAVAADDVAGGDGFVAVGELDRDAVGRFGAVLHAMTPPHFDVVEPVEAGIAIRHRPWAGRSRCAWAIRSGRPGAPSRRAASVSRRRTAGSGWALCAAEPPPTRPIRLERPQRFVVKADPARVVDEAVSFVDHQRANTLQPKDIGQREPDGAGPDDDDVHLLGHVNAPAGSPDGAR